MYADAGYAQFNAGNIQDSIRLLNLALRECEMLLHDTAESKTFPLSKTLPGTIEWMAKHGIKDNTADQQALPAGLCSDPETNEKILALPDFPTGYAWLYLAQIEYTFGYDSSVLEDALQTPDRDAYPALSSSLSLLEAQYDFRNKTFDNLPQRIYQLIHAHASMHKHNLSGKGIREKGIYSISIPELSSVASVESIVVVLVTALLVGLRTGKDMHDFLAIWRANSLELPIKENMFRSLDLIESILSENQNNALAVLESQDTKHENRLAAALKIVFNNETGPENLFNAHAFIALSLIGKIWEDPIVTQLAEIFSAQWLEKIKSPAVLQTPRFTVPQIEDACKASETGKKKIGKILLAAQQAVSIRVPTETLQQIRRWAES